VNPRLEVSHLLSVRDFCFEELRRHLLDAFRDQLTTRWEREYPGTERDRVRFRLYRTLDEVHPPDTVLIVAWVEPAPQVEQPQDGVLPCPECLAGKHGNCDGTTWDTVADEPADCPCAANEHGVSA
jgi:hypothetical protein